MGVVKILVWVDQNTDPTLGVVGGWAGRQARTQKCLGRAPPLWSINRSLVAASEGGKMFIVDLQNSVNWWNSLNCGSQLLKV